MIKRLSRLEMISSEYERSLWKHYSYRGWRGFEPYDDVLPVERPENLRAAFEMLVAEGSSDLSNAIEDAGLLAKDVAELTGVSETALRLVSKPKMRLVPREPASDYDNVVAFSPRGRKDSPKGAD
jgi:hypothetical protein